MDVVDHARAGDPPEVPAHVVALRRERLRERTDALRSEPVDLERFFVLELAEVADVAKGATIRCPDA